MAGIQLGGLASGLDTGAVISQLMSVERKPRQRFELRQAVVQARQDGLRDIVGKLRTLKNAAADLRSVSLWASTQKITNTDPAKLDAIGAGSAAAGSYAVEVTSLATSAQRTYAYTPPNGQSTWTINGTDVRIAPNATVDEAIASINGTAGVGVSAANVGGALVLTDLDTGAASSVVAVGDGLTEDPALSRAGTDASVTVNGTTTTSSTNAVAGAISGLDLTLKALGTSTLTVEAPTVDRDRIAAKVKAFVEAYNGANEAMRSRLGEKRVVNAQTAADARKGALFADVGVSTASSSLRQAIMDPVEGNDRLLDTLAELGITTGAAAATSTPDALAGKLVLDEAKLKDAIATNLGGVQRLLGGTAGVGGIAQRFEAAIDPLAAAGRGLDGKALAAGEELTRLRKSLEQFDDRMVRKEQRLRKQFTALEQALAASQARQAEIIGKLGS